MKKLFQTFHHGWSVFIASFIFVLTATFTSPAQIRLVADLAPGSSNPEDENESYTYHQASNGRSFFLANGVELWTSNGTPEGTTRIRQFQDIDEMVVINGIAYMTVFTPEHGFELWRSDGTPAGTSLFMDIYPGSGSSTPSSMVNFNGLLFFSANNKTNGRELWKSDGTVGGTQLVADLQVGSVSSNPSKLTPVGNKLFLVANSGIASYELFVSDGTLEGTHLVKDIYPKSGVSSSPTGLTNVNGLLLFSANAPVIGRQLWKSDGTSEGTQLVKVIRPGGQSAQVDKMINVNGTAFFQANDGIHGLELWKSDGTADGTLLVKDITPGPGSAVDYGSEHINHFAAGMGKLFFIAVADESQAIWVSDGTSAGTHPVTDANVSFSFNSPAFQEINGQMYFLGYLPNLGSEGLFKTDGNTIILVKENIDNPWGTNAMFRNINGTYFFITADTYWQSDGTSQGTYVVKDLSYPSGSYPRGLADMNGTLIFSQSTAYSGLWKSNGTPESTVLIKNWTGIEEIFPYGNKAYFDFDLYPAVTDGTPEGTIQLSSDAWIPKGFTGANGLMFFSANGNGKFEELWQTDGTVAGTKMTKDIHPTGSSSPTNLTAVNNTLYFAAYEPGTGNEIWKSNGTTEGTILVKDINPGTASSGPVNTVSFSNKLYFQANDGTHGTELWTSDGTPSGTFMLKDIRTSDLSGEVDMGQMMATSKFFVFSVRNEAGKIAIWKSDGTAPGTTKLVDVETTEFPRMVGSISTQVFFSVPFAGYRELWSSNGTPSGTRRLRKLPSSIVTKGTVLNNILYVSTLYTPTNTTTIIRSNGRSSGTYEIPFDGSAHELTASGSLVYFHGLTREHGHELFAIDEHVEATSVSAEILEDALSVDAYPNPFRSSMAVHVAGEMNETFTLKVITPNGQRVSETTMLPCNTDHQIGNTWRPGLYILQIRQTNKTLTRKIIKTN